MVGFYAAIKRFLVISVSILTYIKDITDEILIVVCLSTAPIGRTTCDVQ